jgi:hypothetical protein
LSLLDAYLANHSIIATGITDFKNSKVPPNTFKASEGLKHLTMSFQCLVQEMTQQALRTGYQVHLDFLNCFTMFTQKTSEDFS